MEHFIERVALLNEPAVVHWEARFATCVSPAPVSATTFIKAYPSASHPVAVGCDDGKQYIVKGRHLHNGRVACNEQIVGLLGRALGAPVGEVAIVHVPDALIAIQPEMAHLWPGLAHGSRFIPAISPDRQTLQHYTDTENRDRFVKLAVLYGWVAAADHQFFYENNPPRRVYSVDHGYFFGNGTWDITSLALMPPAVIDAHFDPCVFNPGELRAARTALDNVSEQMIARAVMRPPEGWGLTKDERIAMAEFLSVRRGQLLAAL